MSSKRIDNFGKINRDKIITFIWEKKNYCGYERDTLSYAL